MLTRHFFSTLMNRHKSIMYRRPFYSAAHLQQTAGMNAGTRCQNKPPISLVSIPEANSRPSRMEVRCIRWQQKLFFTSGEIILDTLLVWGLYCVTFIDIAIDEAIVARVSRVRGAKWDVDYMRGEIQTVPRFKTNFSISQWIQPSLCCLK